MDVILPMVFKLLVIILTGLIAGLLITRIERHQRKMQPLDGDKVTLVFPPWYPRLAGALMLISCLCLLLVVTDVMDADWLSLYFFVIFLIPAFFIIWSFYTHAGYFTDDGIFYKGGLKQPDFYPWYELESVKTTGKEYHLVFKGHKSVKVHRLMLGSILLLHKAELVLSNHEL